MKKRLFTALLLAALVLTLAVCAGAAPVVKEGEAGDSLTWTLDGDGLLTFRGEGDMWDFAPAEPEEGMEDLPAVPWRTEEGNTLVTSVRFCEGMTSIGQGAFDCAYNLKGTVTLPSSVKRIGNWAFSVSGIEKVLLNEGLEEIGWGAFENCSGLRGDLVIPDSVRELGRFAFAFTGYRGTLTLGKDLETIGGECFDDVLFTGSLVIPDKVVSVGEFAFDHWSPTGETDGEGNAVYGSCPSFTGTLTLGKSLEYIGPGAFCEDGFTGGLTLPAGLREIGEAAFNNCFFTGDLVIPDSVETMGPLAFNNSGFTGSLTVGAGLAECQRFGK